MGCSDPCPRPCDPTFRVPNQRQTSHVAQITQIANGVVLETLTKIPLQDRATDPGQLQKVEGTMDRRQLVVPNLQPAGVANPLQGAFHNPADLPQAAAMRRPRLLQVVLVPPCLVAIVILLCAILPF